MPAPPTPRQGAEMTRALTTIAALLIAYAVVSRRLEGLNVSGRDVLHHRRPARRTGARAARPPPARWRADVTPHEGSRPRRQRAEHGPGTLTASKTVCNAAGRLAGRRAPA